MPDIFTLHRALANARVTLTEKDFMRELSQRASCDVHRDAFGNLICRKKGRGKRIMCVARADCAGLMVRSVDENGFVWAAPAGSISAGRLINARMRFINGARGVVRLADMPENMKKLPGELGFGDIYLDLGARTRAEASVSAGDVCFFDGEPRLCAQNRVIGAYASNILSSALLLCAVEACKNSANDLYFVFTVRGEAGARAAALSVQPELAVSLDVCPACDTPEGEKSHSDIALGAGPAINVANAGVFCSQGLYSVFQKLAERTGIKIQREISLAGASDALSLQLSPVGAPSAGLSVPVRGLGSNAEVFDMCDADACLRLLSALLCARF